MQALKHKYDIISYRSELTSEVTGLLNDFWGGDPEVNRAYLRWKHEDNPYTDRPLAFVAAHGGKVRGFRGYFALQWYTHVTHNLWGSQLNSRSEKQFPVTRGPMR